MTELPLQFALTELSVEDSEGINDLSRLDHRWYEDYFGANPGNLPDFWHAKLRGDAYFTHRLWIARGPAGDQVDVPLGMADLTLPNKEDTDQAWVEIIVPPVHRGRGVGRFLVENALRPAIEESGRSIVSFFSELVSESREENSLTRELGLEPKCSAHSQKLDLPLADDRFRRLRDATLQHINGYRIDGWVGEVPDEHIDLWCELVNEFSRGLPMEDFESEPPLTTPDRIREREEKNRQTGKTFVTSVAFAKDGSLVALTQAEVGTSASCTLALQANLIVTHAHRGHRLGMAVKLEGLRLLHEYFPNITTIATWNSQVNVHPLGLNREIGFRQIGREVCYQGQVQRGVV
ncbi:MAG TPA: GNAT family N-acetyltransferase [Candidatus Corynebacterium avicola]|uniref:GNAT family N-acetyltransferase n=1 Tax=Candidatus Corynebacterium avicola TaxID=2838527 RepID=A0A9D1RS04_9CORY|nr:GNAT family N-acetyltransferase [Candidatus Corynebacterium avicola]